jgi:hypothetical protein
MKGGVGAGASAARYLPPRASFFGVRSLSFVLADFGTLFLFLLFIFYSLFLVFFFGCNHLSFSYYQDSCQRFESEQTTKKTAAI